MEVGIVKDWWITLFLWHVRMTDRPVLWTWRRLMEKTVLIVDVGVSDGG